uniref:Uncharacterized protein n=1 Tax=Picea sitchensis TaxID=3332 RepID=A9NWM4_PICSI|nr:unknown [Picea sitchensis]
MLCFIGECVKMMLKDGKFFRVNILLIPSYLEGEPFKLPCREKTMGLEVGVCFVLMISMRGCYLCSNLRGTIPG